MLRLQARKTKSEEVKKELKEAQRRVQTIAMVHEGLSQTADEIVDYDKVISSLLKMAVDLATMRDQHIDIDFIGRFGMMPAQDATPLSLVLTELITNPWNMASKVAKKVISRFPWDAVATTSMLWSKTMARAWPMRSMMVWHVPPDPVGTQIISTFVNNDFGGTVRWEPRRGGGTRVVLDMKLRAAQER